MIQLKNISKSFNTDKKQEVLKDINLKINHGDFITIMGPSGGGKSTLLNIISLLDNPSKGEVVFNDKVVNFKKDDILDNIRRNDIGLIFQNPNLITSLTPLENLIIAMDGKENYKNKKDKGEELLDKVGLIDKKYSKVNSLSGGESQRVAVVRALVNNPKIILCDEPTGALDSLNGEKVINLLLQIRKESGCGLIVVTHDENIGALGERRLKIKDGVVSELV